MTQQGRELTFYSGQAQEVKVLYVCMYASWYNNGYYCVAMSLQFGFFAQLTWGEYSWDIMEPVTYFTTCATLIGIYVYFALIRQVQYTVQY